MKPELAEWMRAAHEAGLSVVPAGPGKRPTVTWKGRGLAELDELTRWEHEPHDAYAILCGGTERLVVLDFESGFDFFAFAELLRDADLYDVFESWMDEFWVQTPSGGRHVYIKLMGDEPVPGNTKLAADPSMKCLAETRGDGGLVIAPMSNGRTHANGGLWMPAGSVGFEGIKWVPREQFDAVCAVIVSMSEAPLSAPPSVVRTAPAGGVSLAELEHSSSWVDVALQSAPSMASVLEQYGWRYHREDADYRYWSRPGKDLREGWSATVNASDRLFVFSSNAAPVPPSPGRTTYDVADVIAFYEHTDRLSVLRRWRPEPTCVGQAPASDLCLPTDFWSATPLLAHIRQAAWSRRISPDTLYEAVKAMYAATIPWNFRLPDDGTLDYVGLMVGNSGSGKTRSKKAAMALLPPEIHQLDGVRLSMPAPSSGEGIVESYIRRQGGKQVGLEYRGLGFYTDEGQHFFSVLDRSGNTLAEVIKSGWMGEMTGSVAATQDRHRVLSPGEVRLSVLIGIQIDVAAQFLSASHTNGGLPQRANWAWAYHPEWKSAADTPWPGPLDVAVWDRMRWGGGDGANLIHTLTLESSVNKEMRERQDARAASPDSGLLDAHAEFAILKTAGVLALMHGEMEVSSAFWELACSDWNLTCAVRNEVARRAQATVVDRDVALGRAHTARNLASIDVYLDRAIASLVRKVSSQDRPLLASEAKNHLSSYRKRHQLAYTEIIDAAVARGKLVIHSSGGLTPT